MDGILNSLSLPDTSSPPCSTPSAPPVGIIEEVHGPIIDILCRSLPPLHQALFVCIDGERYVFEVHRHLDESRARAIALHRTSGLRRLMPVFDTGGPLQVPVSPLCLGRLLDIFGQPLDGGQPLEAGEFRHIVSAPGPLSEAAGMGAILPTGIKVIDLLCPFVRGGRTVCSVVRASARARWLLMP